MLDLYDGYILDLYNRYMLDLHMLNLCDIWSFLNLNSDSFSWILFSLHLIQ